MNGEQLWLIIGVVAALIVTLLLVIGWLGWLLRGTTRDASVQVPQDIVRGMLTLMMVAFGKTASPQDDEVGKLLAGLAGYDVSKNDDGTWTVKKLGEVSINVTPVAGGGGAPVGR